MSDSQFKSGYRRDRRESIDPSLLGPPDADTPPRGKSPVPEEEEVSYFKRPNTILDKFMNFMFILHNAVFLICAILAIIVGSLLLYVFNNTGQSAKDVADGAALFLLLNGILCSQFAIWGLVLSRKPNRFLTILYLAVLIFVLVINIVCYSNCYNLALNVYNSIKQYWGTMNDSQRAILQDYGYCCGYTGPLVMAASPCPEGSTSGCLQSYYDMQASSEQATGGFFGFSIVTFFMCFMQAVRFGFRKETKKHDDGSDIEAAASPISDRGKAFSPAN